MRLERGMLMLAEAENASRTEKGREWEHNARMGKRLKD